MASKDWGLDLNQPVPEGYSAPIAVGGTAPAPALAPSPALAPAASAPAPARAPAVHKAGPYFGMSDPSNKSAQILNAAREKRGTLFDEAPTDAAGSLFGEAAAVPNSPMAGRIVDAAALEREVSGMKSQMGAITAKINEMDMLYKMLGSKVDDLARECGQALLRSSAPVAASPRHQLTTMQMPEATVNAVAQPPVPAFAASATYQATAGAQPPAPMPPGPAAIPPAAASADAGGASAPGQEKKGFFSNVFKKKAPEPPAPTPESNPGAFAHLTPEQTRIHDLRRKKLTGLFERFDPKRVAQVDKILWEFRGKEPELFEKLEHKYGMHAVGSTGVAANDASYNPLDGQAAVAARNVLTRATVAREWDRNKPNQDMQLGFEL